MDSSIKVVPPPPEPAPTPAPALPPAEHPTPLLPPHRIDPKRARWWLFGVGILLLIVAAAGVVTLSLVRKHRESSQAKLLNDKIDKGPVVQLAKVTMSPAVRKVILPGDARAFFSTSLYGKTAGYLKSITVDKGDHVKKGALLAIIQSPETDQDVMASEADVVLKEEMQQRADLLARSGVVSQQDRETADTNLRTSKATLERNRVLKGYEVLRAPFDGTVTARYVDPGALIPASTGSTTSATPVLDLANTDTLRVTVYLGQDVAAFVKVGDQVNLWRDERPNDVFVATISRLAGALDPRTRTMLAEIWFDNRTAQIFPGTYVHVLITVKSDAIPSVPAEALFFRKGELLVGVVTDDKVKFAPVVEAENDGPMVRLSSGVKGDENVILNPPSDLQDGAPVQVKKKGDKGDRGSAPDGGDDQGDKDSKAGAQAKPAAADGGSGKPPEQPPSSSIER